MRREPKGARDRRALTGPLVSRLPSGPMARAPDPARWVDIVTDTAYKIRPWPRLKPGEPGTKAMAAALSNKAPSVRRSR